MCLCPVKMVGLKAKWLAFLYLLTHMNNNLTNLFAEGRIQVQVQLTVKLNNKQTMLMTATNKINNIFHLYSTEIFINYKKKHL